MSLTLNDVHKVARLSQLNLSSEQAEQTLAQMNTIFGLIDQMSQVDTSGIAPLMHPIAMIQEMNQRLRTDVVSEPNNREANMANAPRAEQGLFLVPKVIE